MYVLVLILSLAEPKSPGGCAAGWLFSTLSRFGLVFGSGFMRIKGCFYAHKLMRIAPGAIPTSSSGLGFMRIGCRFYAHKRMRIAQRAIPTFSSGGRVYVVHAPSRGADGGGAMRLAPDPLGGSCA